jgi:hypothetical protein
MSWLKNLMRKTLETYARSEAREKNWRLEKIEGDLRLIKHLINEDWDENEVLTVCPDYKIKASFDPYEIICSEKVNPN